MITPSLSFHHTFLRLARKYHTSFVSNSHTLCSLSPRDFAINFLPVELIYFHYNIIIIFPINH